uniref:Conotoxin Vc6.11 n=1 Tax=Conus victoriae TaxID=319920 RepID=O26B_CONVC|nr:RecName: Full=Conotoxin Vc6.11; Flags: Precursor [Conus victoriae]AEA35360.1 O-conotoxin Vc6.11 precursor [Conus victoriae]
MEKLTILLLVAAVLMSTQALIQEQRQKAKINLFSKRKPSAERWWGENDRRVFGSCTADEECCFNNCVQAYCFFV